MVLLDGKKLSEKILNNLKKETKNRRLGLKLAVVLVGNDAASRIFINQKKKACEKVGIGFELFEFSAETGSPPLKEEIKKIVNNPDNSGVIIQLPLPERFNTEEFLNLIPKEKDVDVLSAKGFEKFAKGTLPILPPVIGAVSVLFKNYGIRIGGKNVVVVGGGRLVGKPFVAWLKFQNAKFLALDKNTKNISFYTKKADILISGVGKKNLITGDMIKKGATVVDFGGDVDFKSVSKKAGYLTPIPGGVGPLTVACLLENLTKIK